MRWFRAGFTFTLGLAFLLASVTPTTAQEMKTPDWSYTGETGPQNWATLNSDYAACKGDRQSPINLKKAKRYKKKPAIKLQYEASPASVVNRKRSTQVNTKGGLLTLGTTAYMLQQFHIHVPAEHTVDGKRHGAELHLVHRIPGTNRRAVIALFVREGSKRNPALKPLVEGVEKGQKMTLESYDTKSLFPSDWRTSYYRYAGSLTTPPCTGNVQWMVLSNPIQASKEQMKTLRARRKGNMRPIQPRNDRRVWVVRSEK